MTLLNIQGVFIAKNCYTHIQDVGNSIRPQNLLKSCLLCPITVIVRETEEKTKTIQNSLFVKQNQKVFHILYITVWLTPMDCGTLSGLGYNKGSTRYDISPPPYSWDTARTYCTSRGGDLAVTGMNDLAVRL